VDQIAALETLMQKEISRLETSLQASQAQSQNQQTRITQLDDQQKQFVEKQVILEATTRTLRMALETLNEVNQQQAQALANLAEETDCRLQASQSDINNLSGKQARHKEKLNDISSLVLGQGREINNLGYSIENQQLNNQTHYRKLTVGLTTLAMTVMGAFLYFHYSPDASSVDALEGSTLAEMSQQMEQNAQQVAQNARQVEQNAQQTATVSASLNEQMTDLKVEITRFESESQAVSKGYYQQANDKILALQAQLVELQDSLTGLEDQLAAPVLPQGRAPTAFVALNDNAWIDGLDPTHYSIQLLGSHRKESLISFVNQNIDSLGAQPLSYNASSYQGRDWYNLFYGDFATGAEARAVLATLPHEIQSQGPWIRSIWAIQKHGVK
jgi:hypothetical protein